MYRYRSCRNHFLLCFRNLYFTYKLLRSCFLTYSILYCGCNLCISGTLCSNLNRRLLTLRYSSNFFSLLVFQVVFLILIPFFLSFSLKLFPTFTVLFFALSFGALAAHLHPDTVNEPPIVVTTNAACQANAQ